MKYSSFRKFTAGLSTLTLLVTSLFTFGVSVTAATTFTDADEISDWATTYISQLVDAGVLSGNPDGSFNPQGNLNRAEIAKIAVLAAALTTDTTGAPHFNDVKADDWFYNYVETLYNNGVVGGINGGALDSDGKATYNPAGIVDRASAAKILVTAFDLETAYAGTPPNFADVAKSAWYFDYVESAYAHGLLSGYENGNFGPADAITREQIAKIAQNSKTEAADGSLKLSTYTAGAASSVADDEEPVGTSDGTLAVALAAGTPASATVPGAAVNVPFTTIDFTASSAGDVSLSSILVKHAGLGARTDLSKVSLLDESSKVLVKGRTINSDEEVTLTISPALIIAAGTTKTLTIAATISSTQVSGAEHRLEVEAVESITSNAKSVSGSFPIVGKTMVMGSVDIGTITFDATNTDATVNVGETNVILSEFDIDAPTSGNGDASLSYIRLKNAGSAKDDAAANFTLIAEDGTTLATDAEMTSDFIEFSLETPYLLEEGNSYSFQVRGDIEDGQGDGLEFIIDEDTDVLAESSKYESFGVAVNIAAMDAIADTALITIEGAEITIDFDGPVATDVADDTDNFVFANFKITSEKDVELTSLTVDVTETDGADAGVGVVDIVDLELVDSANGALYSSTAGAGNADADADAPATYEFENIVLTGGKDYTFQIRGDIPDGAGVADTYQAAIDFSADVTAEYVASGDTVAAAAYSTSSLAGKTMTVAAPTLTARVVTLNAFTSVGDANGILIYKGTLEANDIRDIKVTKIVVDREATSGLANYGVAFDSMKLVQIKADGTEVTLDTENSLTAATSVTFSGFTLNIPKGLSNKVTYGVRADVKSDPTAGTLISEVDAAANYTAKDSENNTVDVTASTTNGPTVTLAAAGSFTITVDTTESGTNAAKYALAGKTVLLGRYKLDAQDEAVRIRDLTITNGYQATATLTVGAAPATTETITIGTCVVTFINGGDGEGVLQDELNCTDSAATIDLEADTGVDGANRTAAQVSAIIDTLTNVGDAAHTTLTVSAGAAATTIFTGAKNITAAIAFTDGTAGDVTNSATRPAMTDDIENIIIFKDKAMTQEIARVGLNSAIEAVFDDVNYDVAEAGVQYLYVAAAFKGIGDEGSNTATSNRKIVLDDIAAGELIVEGLASGDAIAETFTAGSEPTTTLVAAQITNVANSGTNAALNNGTYELFRFKVTADTNTNITDGETSDIILEDVKLTLSGAETDTNAAVTAGRVGITAITVQRLDKSSDGEVTHTISGDTLTTQTIAFDAIFTNDHRVESGEVAEYVVRAVFIDVGADESAQAQIASVDGGDIVWGDDSSTGFANLLIQGLTRVTGHTLSK